MPTREQQYSTLRRQLEEDLKSTRAAVGELADETEALVEDSDQEGGVPSNHMADYGTNVYETETLMTIELEMRDRITAIEDALRRMDNGTYGICQRCGRQIAIARLRAMPFAAFCIECQEIIDAQSHVTGLKEQLPLDSAHQ